MNKCFLKSNKITSKTISVILALFLGLNTFAMKQDSIGMKNINGKKYVMHKVSKGEGVYGIAKKYNTSANEIYAANEGADKGIKIDQVILIPRGGSGSGISVNGNGNAQTNTELKTTKKEKVYHTVSSGQTLSAIAKKFNTNVNQIKTWNNLKSDNINLGQKLIVGEKTITITKPAIKPTNETKPDVIEVEQVEIIPDLTMEVEKTEKTTPVVEAQVDKAAEITTAKVEEMPKVKEVLPVQSNYKVDDGDEVTEKGIADISSEGELSQDRSFILHPTAKIGTIMMITNPTNNSAVFVRVVGTCKTSNGIILKMSKSVAEKLGVNNNAEVSISYAK